MRALVPASRLFVIAMCLFYNTVSFPFVSLLLSQFPRVFLLGTGGISRLCSASPQPQTLLGLLPSLQQPRAPWGPWSGHS